MYKFVGFGLLAFLALLIIPVSSSTQSDNPSMYGMATVSLKDESGNILIENQMHNEVVDQGTAFMLNQTFNGGTWPTPVNILVNGLCVSNANSFSTADSETPFTFNAANTIGPSLTNCHEMANSWDTLTPTSISVSSIFLPGTAFASGTTITGIGVCGITQNPDEVHGCEVGSGSGVIALFSVIDIPDTPVGSGSQLEVRYTFNLD